MSAPYVELSARTAFSFGDGAVTPEALVARAQALGYTALGLTDTADFGGIIRFALEARRRAIKPIIGVELAVDGYPATFLARTAEGYRNLAGLITRARLGHVGEWRREDTGAKAGTPARGHPYVAWDAVCERREGLYALTGPASGEIATLLRTGREADARQAVRRWREVFGEWLAIEVQDHHAGRTGAVLAGRLIELAESEDVPWVVTHAPRYLDQSSRLVHDMLTALRAGLTLHEASKQGVLLPNGHWRLQAPEAMRAQWARRPAGLEESLRIAAVCDFDLSWVRPPLPDFPLDGRPSTDAYLEELVCQGAHERWGDLSDAQDHQLKHELGIIQRLGFAGFFLVMWDAVREARTRNILCQGRGSAANSAVAYCLGITAVDPVRHGLLFERFLSEARTDGLTEAPDIDLDLEHERREEILDYSYGRWGREHAALTGIVQTYHAPNAVLDAMRAFGYPAEQAARLSKRVHRLDAAEGATRLQEGLAAEHGLDFTSATGQAMLATMTALQNLPRLRSTHPGGFVLSSAHLGDYLPIEPTTMGRTIIQFDKDDLDTVGVPKFDFLGLGALTQVRRAFDLIAQRHGEVRPSIYQMPPNDPDAFQLIADGDTIGMFQIESRAQIASLVHTRPDRLYDIVVQVALVRPGPIQAGFVHPYTRRRRGLEPVVYAHPALEPILRRTQGIPIFQEQAMAIAMTLAGYSATDADELRRTMGNERKMPKLLAALARLYHRMIAQGIEPEVAGRITKDLQSFGNYGFPESHAWSFALIAYATAWLKAHQPAAFYAGILNAWPMGFYSPSTLVHDAKRHGVEVRRPCLAVGTWDCTLEETGDPKRPAVRIGWRHIRGFGARGRDALQHARGQGPFTSIADVVCRAALMPHEASALARAHAFAAWESDPRRAAWAALRVAGDRRPLAPSYDDIEGTGYHVAPRGRGEEILDDYATTGLSVIGHPMEAWQEWRRKTRVLDTRSFSVCGHGDVVVVAGLVVVRQRPETAKGTVFLLLEDEFGVANVIVAPALVEEYREIVHHTPMVAVHGRVQRDGPEVNLIAQALQPLNNQTALVYHSHDFR